MDLEWYLLYISLIGANSTNSNNKNFYHKYGCFRFSNFFNKRSFCILFCINIYYNWSGSGTSTGTVNLEVFSYKFSNSSILDCKWVCIQFQSLAGLLTLTSIQVEGAQLSTYVPAGYFVKLRTISSGTTSFTYVSGIEVLDN